MSETESNFSFIDHVSCEFQIDPSLQKSWSWRSRIQVGIRSNILKPSSGPSTEHIPPTHPPATTLPQPPFHPLFFIYFFDQSNHTALKMPRMTPELLLSNHSYLNPLKDRELDLRGLQIPAIENLGVTKVRDHSLLLSTTSD